MKGNDKVTVICYGQEEEWKSRNEAMKYYLQGMLECDGSERERYTTILAKLMEGRTVCSDEDD